MMLARVDEVSKSLSRESRGVGFQPVIYFGESQAGSLCHEVFQPGLAPRG